MFQAFKAAGEAGDYTELPMLPAQVDPQVFLSRNSVPQPFFLVCGKDTVIAQLSGEAQLQLRDSSVNTFALAPGDNVYVPAGTPHRIVPLTEVVQLRYKPAKAGLEGVAWFCEECGLELCRAEWDTAEVVSHRAYYDACLAFNADPQARACRRCGTEHPSVDLDRFTAWLGIAKELEDERAAAAKAAAAKAAAGQQAAPRLPAGA
jgi:3-hydroxyanthranilate 3,4-dioxygenase